METAPVRRGRLLRVRPRRRAGRAATSSRAPRSVRSSACASRARSTGCGARSTSPTRSSSSRPARATVAWRARCCAPRPRACARCGTCSSSVRPRCAPSSATASRWSRPTRRSARSCGARDEDQAVPAPSAGPGVHRARGAARARGRRRGRARQRAARQPAVRDRASGTATRWLEVRVGAPRPRRLRGGAGADRRRPRLRPVAPAGTRVPDPAGDERLVARVRRRRARRIRARRRLRDDDRRARRPAVAAHVPRARAPARDPLDAPGEQDITADVVLEQLDAARPFPRVRTDRQARLARRARHRRARRRGPPDLGGGRGPRRPRRARGPQPRRPRPPRSPTRPASARTRSCCSARAAPAATSPGELRRDAAPAVTSLRGHD